MKVGDIVIATENTITFDEGEVGLLVCVDRGQLDKDYRPLYFVQWNSCPNADPFDRDVNGKKIEVLYSS